MRHLHKMLAITMVCIWLAACQSEERINTSSMGWMRFDISVSQQQLAPPLSDFAFSLATADGAYSRTWADIEQFPEFESFYATDYVATAVSGEPRAEGYGCQCYYGSLAFSLPESMVNRYTIDCSLQQAMVNVRMGQGLAASYPGAKAMMHSFGNNYVAWELGHGPMLLMPGSTQTLVTLQSPQGQEATVDAGLVLATSAAEEYDVSIDFHDGVLSVACGSQKAEIAIDETLFSTPAPSIEAQGFVSGQALQVSEGFTPTQPVKMAASAPSGLQALTLTAIGGDGALQHVPSECNLLDGNAALSALGLKTTLDSPDKAEIDFTELLANISVSANSNMKFIVTARDRYGRVSAPSVLSVDIASVSLQIASQTKACIGVDSASVTIAANTADIEAADFKIYGVDPQNGAEKELEITGASIEADKRLITLSFNVDPGLAPEQVAIYYMGNPKLTTVIERDVPEYTMWVDAFAATAILVFETPSEKITEALVNNATVMANGAKAGILARYPKTGHLVISGLKPRTQYEIQPVVIAGAYAPVCKITTEEAADVPSGDFEDFTPLIKYDKLPQGGAYSTSPFPLYNMQNFADVKVDWTQKHWASVNAKTFCEKAANHNTWYMQPSSAIDFSAFSSGAKSVKMQSVGWSLQGEDIAPYTQVDGQYLPYNNNVPHVAHRAAGRLFLGSYEFDPATGAESYAEGLDFGSRPSSLNGFYKYVPDASAPSDNGYVRVEIINTEGPAPVVIASAEKRLQSSPDFIAFNLPLRYEILGLKANKLKIMFASSDKCGTIEEEDANVPATASVQDAAYLGSALWIDNLLFSY